MSFASAAVTSNNQQDLHLTEKELIHQVASNHTKK